MPSPPNSIQYRRSLRQELPETRGGQKHRDVFHALPASEIYPGHLIESLRQKLIPLRLKNLACCIYVERASNILAGKYCDFGFGFDSCFVLAVRFLSFHVLEIRLHRRGRKLLRSLFPPNLSAPFFLHLRRQLTTFEKPDPLSRRRTKKNEPESERATCGDLQIIMVRCAAPHARRIARLCAPLLKFGKSAEILPVGSFPNSNLHELSW